MTPKLFSELGLSEEVLKAIDKPGFEKAAPLNLLSFARVARRLFA